MKIVEVNSVAGWGSTGRIAEQIGRLAVGHGHNVWMAYGREPLKSVLPSYRIGGKQDVILHGLKTRLIDGHGLGSGAATRSFIKWIAEINPDIVHLHNIHGYYLNYPILFDWLHGSNAKIIWTLHDCWTLTGHCSFFEFRQCNSWMTGCGNCEGKCDYPSSFTDFSARNYNLKKSAWGSIVDRLTLVPVSDWLADICRRSPIMKGAKIEVIKNGIDLNVFHPLSRQKRIFDIARPYVLGVASVWESRKGLNDFIELRRILDKRIGIKLVGLTPRQISSLPDDIEGIERTENVEALATIYGDAVALINPTYEDTFPTVNLESLACGTPVVTYRTGGSQEAVDESTGIVVDKGSVGGLASAIRNILDNPGRFTAEACRRRAEINFDKDKQFGKYVDIYERLLRNL